MAVVKRSTVKILGIEFRKVYNYDVKTGKFWMLLPTILKQELHREYSRISGVSVDDLDKQLDLLVQQVKDKNTVVTRVIAIKAKLTATIWGDELDEDGDMQIISTSQEVSFADGLAVSLVAGVYSETKTSLDVGFTVKYTYQHSRIPQSFRQDKICDHYAIIPWTQELEDTIAAYCVRLQAIALAAKDLANLVSTRG